MQKLSHRYSIFSNRCKSSHICISCSHFCRHSPQSRRCLTAEMQRQVPGWHDQLAGKLSSLIVTANLGADVYEKEATKIWSPRPCHLKKSYEGNNFNLNLRVPLVLYGCQLHAVTTSVKPELRRAWKDMKDPLCKDQLSASRSRLSPHNSSSFHY